MNSRKIGSLDVSVVGLGCNNFGWGLDRAASERVVRAALDAGVTFFDTADIYGETKSEEYVGSALRGRRDDVLIATKFGMPLPDGTRGASSAHVKSAVDGSLRRLNIERIDLFQLHTPDETVPIGETLEALYEIVEAGKVREIGCSNFSADQLRQANRFAAEAKMRPFVSVQNEYSLLHRELERDVLPACEELDMAFLPYFPLAGGMLTGKVRKGQAAPSDSRLSGGGRIDASRFVTDAHIEIVERLSEIAASVDATLLEVAFAWLLSHRPVASVIAGATKPEQIAGNARAGMRAFDAETLRRIDEAARPVALAATK